MGSIVGDDIQPQIFWDKHDFLKYLLKGIDRFSRGFITATNLGFDAMALFSDTDLLKNFRPIIRGSNMISVQIPYKKRLLKFIDTFNFYPFSVKKLGELVGLPKLETPDFLGKTPKNYTERQILQEYNIRDSTITYKAVKFFQDGFNKLGAKLKVTSASTSLDLYRRCYQPKRFYQPNRDILNFLYNGYYGGRTEIFKRGRVNNVNVYDVNSLYPSVLTREFPDPDRVIKSSKITLRTINNYEGLCRVKITSPKSYIPYLPYRYETLNKQKKLIFPTGTFKGYYTFFELRKALELGYTINRFYSGVIYTRMFRPFKKYIETLYKLRLKYKSEGNDMEGLVKLCMNSLYGKFAQKIDYKEVIRHVDDTTIDMLNKSNDYFLSGKFFVFKEKFKHVPKFVNPIFSIYTTAYARDVIFQYMQQNNGSVFYCDTDSLFTENKLRTSKALGDMKLEYTINDGILVKPKMYLANDKVKCKGIPRLDINQFKELLVTKSHTKEKFVKFKEANKRGLSYNQIIQVTKMLDLEDNKRVWTEKFNPNYLQDSNPIKI